MQEEADAALSLPPAGAARGAAGGGSRGPSESRRRSDRRRRRMRALTNAVGVPPGRGRRSATRRGRAAGARACGWRTRGSTSSTSRRVSETGRSSISSPSTSLGVSIPPSQPTHTPPRDFIAGRSAVTSPPSRQPPRASHASDGEAIRERDHRQTARGRRRRHQRLMPIDQRCRPSRASARIHPCSPAAPAVRVGTLSPRPTPARPARAGRRHSGCGTRTVIAPGSIFTFSTLAGSRSPPSSS